jgi:hypothetical protein
MQGRPFENGRTQTDGRRSQIVKGCAMPAQTRPTWECLTLLRGRALHKPRGRKPRRTARLFGRLSRYGDWTARERMGRREALARLAADRVSMLDGADVASSAAITRLQQRASRRCKAKAFALGGGCRIADIGLVAIMRPSVKLVGHGSMRAARRSQRRASRRRIAGRRRLALRVQLLPRSFAIRSPPE